MITIKRNKGKDDNEIVIYTNDYTFNNNQINDVELPYFAFDDSVDVNITINNNSI